MTRKLMICPYFGELPPWMDHFLLNFERLRGEGYEILIDTDEDAFRARVDKMLGIKCPPMYGTGKIWDFRPALGLLYREEITGYDFWGHTDFDVVFGRVERWVTERFLSEIDMHSNCATYVNGSWSLYRNNPLLRHLFLTEPDWAERLEDPEPSGWAEAGFSDAVTAAAEEGGLRKAWTQWQIFEPHLLGQLRLHEDGRLMLGHREVMMAHFRRTKVYPEGCL